MRRFLKITEYSSFMSNKIPERKTTDFDVQLDTGSTIRTSIVDSKSKVCEAFSNDPLDDNIIEEKFFPLDELIIYDDLDITNEDQKVAYVYECPVCFYKTVTTDPQYNFCPQCENSKFTPEVVGLIPLAQMEELEANDKDVTVFQLKDDKLVYKYKPKEKKNIESLY